MTGFYVLLTGAYCSLQEIFCQFKFGYDGKGINRAIELRKS